MSRRRGGRSASNDWRASQFLWISLIVTALSIMFFFAGRSLFNKMEILGSAAPEGVLARAAKWGGLVVQNVTLNIQPEEHQFFPTEKLQARIQELQGESILSIDISDLQNEIGLSPWVEKVEIRRNFPDHLHFGLHLREPRLLLRASDTWILADKDGTFLYASRSLHGNWIDLPRVFGMEDRLLGEPEEMNRLLVKEKSWLKSLSELLTRLQTQVNLQIMRVDIKEDRWTESAVFELHYKSANSEEFKIHFHSEDWRNRIQSLQFVLSDLMSRNWTKASINGIYPERWYVKNLSSGETN